MILNVRDLAYRKDPYPFFRRMRAEVPVCRTAPHGHWAVARYEDIKTILRQPTLFSSQGIGPEPSGGPQYLLETRSLIGVDPPRHARLRGLISKAFVPRLVATLEGRVTQIVQDLLDRLQAEPRFDVVSEFSTPLPIMLMAELLGLPTHRHSEFKAWVHTLLTWRNIAYAQDPEEQQRREKIVEEHAKAMFACFTELIESRRANPCGDLTSHLLNVREGDERLSDLEIMGFMRTLLVAGTEASTNLIGNTLLALLKYPDVKKRVAENADLVPKMIEEVLRHDGPVIGLIRRASADVEIAGVRIMRGEIVLPLLASGNHDESVFRDSERFDIDRDASAHLSFGGSVHFCLGSTLARLQARVAITAFLRMSRDFEGDPGQDLEYLDSFFFRGLKSLVIVNRR